MAIEIRQLVVKSNLVQKAPDEAPVAAKIVIEKLRESLRAECRQMIEEALREMRER